MCPCRLDRLDRILSHVYSYLLYQRHPYEYSLVGVAFSKRIVIDFPC